METEEERQARRKARIEEMKREKRKRELLQKWILTAIVTTAVAAGVGLGFWAAAAFHGEEPQAGSEGGTGIQMADIGDERAATGQEDEGAATGQETGQEDEGAATGQEAGQEEEGASDGEMQGEETGIGEAGQTAEAETEEEADIRSKARHPKGEEAFTQALLAAGRAVVPKGFGLADASPETPMSTEEPAPVETPEPLGGLAAVAQVFETGDDTEGFSEEILSQYGIFVDAQTGTVLAQKEAYERMNPASMTKILTVLVAAEHLTAEDLEETATITIDITDYSFVNDCSNTGYALDEVVTVRDLFYGTILPSGADSALALAIYVAGSHEAFVDMMNDKLTELGLAESSHFTNCVGLYDENHYTTAYDMAVILKAAADNAFCREVMSAHIYTTSQTEQHPEGLRVSNWFLRRIEDRDTHGEVLCGKTGYVDESGSCAASLGVDMEGREYLCVTAGSDTKWTCIADQVALYQRFLPAIETEDAEESSADGTS